MPLLGGNEMKAKRDKKAQSAVVTATSERIKLEAEGGASGALVGAVAGAVAGPPGAIAGAVIGAVAGVLAGAVVDTEGTRRAARTRVLDAEIGVSEGDIGAPNLKHPRGGAGR